MKNSIRLVELCKNHHQQLLQLQDDLVSKKANESAWSIKEIMGHLIDSASNNHQRFVRGGFNPQRLVFDTYRQDQWVSLADYNTSDWQEIVNCWYYFNLQIAKLFDQIPESILKAETKVHNLHLIAFKKPKPDLPVTLEFLVVDYIDHMEHHLNQINQKIS